MEPQYTYLKLANLDYENKFKIELTKDHEVEELENSKNQNYLKILKTSLKIEDDITKWNDYNRIKKLPYFLLEAKKNETRYLNLDINMIVKNIHQDFKFFKRRSRLDKYLHIFLRS